MKITSWQWYIENCVHFFLQMAPDYDHLTLMEKVEVFEHAVNNTAGDDLAKLLWLKSPSSEVCSSLLTLIPCIKIRFLKVFIASCNDIVKVRFLMSSISAGLVWQKNQLHSLPRCDVHGWIYPWTWRQVQDSHAYYNIDITELLESSFLLVRRCSHSSSNSHLHRFISVCLF